MGRALPRQPTTSDSSSGGPIVDLNCRRGCGGAAIEEVPERVCVGVLIMARSGAPSDGACHRIISRAAGAWQARSFIARPALVCQIFERL